MTEHSTNGIDYARLFLGNEIGKLIDQRGVILKASFTKKIEKDLGGKLTELEKEKRALLLLTSPAYEKYLYLKASRDAAQKKLNKKYFLLFTPNSFEYFLKTNEPKEEDKLKLEMIINGNFHPGIYISVNGKITIKERLIEDLELSEGKELALIGIGPCIAIYKGNVEEFFDRLESLKQEKN